MDAPNAVAIPDIEDEQDEIARLCAELHISKEDEAHARQVLMERQAAFVSTLTHDLKNPLTTIMGRVEMLKRVAKRQEITSADLERHLVPLDSAIHTLQEMLRVASQRDGNA